MRSNNDILKELKIISPLIAGFSNNNVFSVPMGYFETLSDQLLACSIKELPVNVVSETFRVPERYFDNFSNMILKKIQTEEKKSEDLNLLPVLLYNIRHINVFKIPPGYLTDLPERVIGKLTATPVKVIHLPSFRQIYKYVVAAAIFIAVVSLSVYKFVDNSFLSKKTAANYAALTTAIEKGKLMNDQQFNEAMNVLSNDDISTYLEKNGIDEDISSISTNLKEDAVPNKDEYFLNEKTLENYLGSFEKKY